MTNPIPKYRPSEAFILAQLDLYQARIEEISSKLKKTQEIEAHGSWYQEKIEVEQSKMQKILIYPICQNPTIGIKIVEIMKKYTQTLSFLEKTLASCLSDRIHQYTIILQKSPDQMIVASFQEIKESFSYFKYMIEDYEFTSPQALQSLHESTIFLNAQYELVQTRLALFQLKQGDTPPESGSLSCKRIYTCPYAPKHVPSRGYILAKIAYRKARIDELGICLEQQQNCSKHKGWFQKKLKQEASRTNALNKYAQHCKVDVSPEITSCETSLYKVQSKLDQLIPNTR